MILDFMIGSGQIWDTWDFAVLAFWIAGFFLLRTKIQKPEIQVLERD